MARPNSLRFTRFAAAIWPLLVVGCSSDDGHGPVIGAPTTPIVISEGGAATSGGSGNPNGGAGIATAGDTSIGGTGATGLGAGTGGVDDPFGTNDPFAMGGTGGTTGDPFVVGGSPGSFSGSAPF